MHKIFGTLGVLISLGAGNLIFAHPISLNPPQKHSNKEQKGNMLSDYTHLSSEEQQFAQQLSSIHHTMFCFYFSKSQRIEAMALISSMAQNTQGQKNAISHDEAVEIVMKNSKVNIAPNQSEQPPASHDQLPQSK